MAQRTCLYCGGPLPEQGAGRPRKFCTDQCARRGAPSERREQMPCAVCGTPVMRKPYVYKDGRQPTCSEACKVALRPPVAKKRSTLPDDHPARWILGQWSTPLRYFHCRDCGELTCYDSRQVDAARCPTCRASRKQPPQRFVAGTCARCGKSFVMDRRGGSGAGLNKNGLAYCSPRCCNAENRTRRRIRKANAYVADVNRAYIFKRDRYTCQICGKRLAMTKQAPHPKSPTLDHIIPLAKGGTHEPANVQAAHFMCNALKSDGAVGDQLLLVG